MNIQISIVPQKPMKKNKAIARPLWTPLQFDGDSAMLGKTIKVVPSED